MSIDGKMFRGSDAVMGLDLSLRSAGICVITDSGEMVLSTVGYSLKGAIDKDKILRIIDIANKIVDFAIKYQVTAVGIEGYAFGSSFGLAQLGELNGVVKAKCYEKLGIVSSAIPCLSIRKYLLEKVPNGSLKAKSAIRNMIEISYGSKFSNNDESDAAAVALVMYDFKNKKRELLQSFQIQILQKLDDAQGRFK
jgi:Holliday junction resolvasome RuvABC endonuclease subunit